MLSSAPTEAGVNSIQFAPAEVLQSQPPSSATLMPPQLLGLMAGQVAYLRHDTEIAKVKLGGEFMGWRVREIGSKQVLVERDGAKASLKLFEQRTDTPPVRETGSVSTGETGGG